MKENLTKIIYSLQKQFRPSLRFCFCCILIGTMHGTLTAQTTSIKVSGKITSGAGEPLEGVTVAEKNSSNSTATDINGIFALIVPGNAVLVITHVGFRKLEVSVANQSQIEIKLDPVGNTMGDVVVVGYTSQRKRSITGAVSTVDMDDLSKTRIPDVAQALQGQVAGVFCCSQYRRSGRWNQNPDKRRRHAWE
jgi:hypothetical protein